MWQIPIDIRVNRNRSGVECRPDTTLIQDMSQVGRDPVAEIEHRVQSNTLDQIDGLADSRSEGQVPSSQAATERPGDKNHVTRLGSTPQDSPLSNRFPDHRDIDH